MIIKIKSYKRMGALKALMRYALEDRKRLFDKEDRSFVLSGNLKGQSINEWAKEIKENEKTRKHRRKNNVMFTQEILSFHRGDNPHLTLEKMQELTKEYMQRRSPHAIYVAAPHFDKNHWHVHCIVAAVGYRTEKSLRMSRAELGELKKGIQAYQVERFSELGRSVVRHGRKTKQPKITEREYQYKRRTKKQTKREYVAELVKSCSINNPSQEEFFARLRATGKLQPYVRGKVSAGVEFEGRRYRFNRLGIDITQLSKSKEIEDLNRSTGRNY